jgi:hypothetical protein
MENENITPGPAYLHVGEKQYLVQVFGVSEASEAVGNHPCVINSGEISEGVYICYFVNITKSLVLDDLVIEGLFFKETVDLENYFETAEIGQNIEEIRQLMNLMDSVYKDNLTEIGNIITILSTIQESTEMMLALGTAGGAAIDNSVNLELFLNEIIKTSNPFINEKKKEILAKVEEFLSEEAVTLDISNIDQMLEIKKRVAQVVIKNLPTGTTADDLTIDMKSIRTYVELLKNQKEEE